MKKSYAMMLFTAVVTVAVPVAHHQPAYAGTGPIPSAEARAGLSAYALVEEQAGEHWESRKHKMLVYSALVNTRNDLPLREIGSVGDAGASALRQEKTALVVHALRRMAGDEAFSRIVARLRAGAAGNSWDELRRLFERELGKDLGWFFSQWVDRNSLPDLGLENVAVRRAGSRFEVSFDLVQKDAVYVLEVPLVISFMRGGCTTERITIDAERKQVNLLVDEEPSLLLIDPDYDVPRMLTEAETPPLLTKLLSEDSLLLVPPVKRSDEHAEFINAWKKRGAIEHSAAELKDADLKGASLLVIGADNPVVGRLYGTTKAGEGAVSILGRKNPWNTDRIVAVVQARSGQLMTEALQAIMEHGECSALSIDGKGRVSQHTERSERGIRMELRAEAAVIEVSAIKTLSDVIEKTSDKRIVYVGEYHDRFAHHTVQLQVIQALHRKDPKLAIGMEMFQTPFQKVLDDYISGAINEREFLKRSEYFKRWSFDFNLYKPILDFARANKVPVIALNLNREIVEKVSRSGMDSLTDEDRKEIPAQLDFSDAEYRDRLRQAFSQHKSSGERDFDNFFQAQVLWDETMSRSIDEYLQKNAGQRMVVLAGLGHLAYGSGIPGRVARRNAFTHATILNDGDVERGIADYLVFPQQLEGDIAPKLMVVLKDDQGKTRIADFPEGSVAKQAGIRVGDVVLAIDGVPVHGTDDLKLELFYKKHDEVVRVRVLRKRFLLGDAEMEFEVKLP